MTARSRCNVRYVVFTAVMALLLVPASSAQTQTPIAGKTVPQFAQPLPLLSVQGGTMNTILADQNEIRLNMCEFKSYILPPGTFAAGVQPATNVWGYSPDVCPATTRDTYIGPLVVATRGKPTQIRFANNLGSTETTQVLAYKNSTDQTLHWADPYGLMCNMDTMMGMPPMNPLCSQHYAGSIPAVPHLHGGEVPPVLDGGPDQWFTSNGLTKGPAYYSFPGAQANEVILRYPNTQEAAPIWFHDHTLGATRLNVYAGLAGAYLVTDPNLTLPTGLHPAGLQQVDGTVTYTIPVVLQDRMFDINGQLYFPAGPGVALNPEHPWWQPEFLGDTMVVNGKAWPYLEVQPRRYRFWFLNGSNARAYELFLTDSVTKINGPAMWQIATDGGYLDSAVKIDPNALAGSMQRLLLLPGERAEVIIDFAGLTPGTKLVLKNVAKSPYPGGGTPTGGMDKILQFRVVAAPTGFVDTSYNPSLTSAVRTPAQKIMRLADPVTGVGLVTPAKKRQLTLNEIMGMGGTVAGIVYPGGPSEILVNNTKFSGESTRPYGDFTTIQIGAVADPMKDLKYSELPDEGTVEQWEIINLTADAHPIHLHLVQFQLINRQAFDVKKYNTAYAAAFGGAFVPGFGPPLDYNIPNADGAIGGNPGVALYLKSGSKPPNPNEAGWKDTVVMYPGQVTRIMVRFAPTDTATNTTGIYPFETNALNRGYVWHCHIIDHEDNEMMRPSYVKPATLTRSYILGYDY